MQFLNPEIREILRDRLKAGTYKKPVVRVEVDKMTYVPTAVTEIDIVRYMVDGKSPNFNENGVNATAVLSFASPIKGMTNEQALAKMSSPYGMRSLRGRNAMHHGIDIATNGNVAAAADGVVINSGPMSTAGYTVEILHANNIRTRYFHMQAGSLKVAVGDTVFQGQVLGVVGSTGDSTGVHLHFEIRTSSTKTVLGKSTDPVPYLKQTATIGALSLEPMTNTATTNDAANFRKSPSTGGQIIRLLSANTSCDVKGKYGEWYKVSIGAEEGYIHSKLLTLGTAVTSDSYGLVTHSGVGLRSSQSVTGSLVASVGVGTILKVLSAGSSWTKVEWLGAPVYIQSEFIRINNRSLVTDYGVKVLKQETFTSFAVGTKPAEYIQDAAGLWVIDADSLGNRVKCWKGEQGSSWMKFSYTWVNAGKVEVKFKTWMVDRIKFNIYVDGKVVGSYGGKSQNYKTVTFTVPSGTHEIKFERVKDVVSTDDAVAIDEFKLCEFNYTQDNSIVQLDDYSLAKIDKAMVIADGAVIRNTASVTGNQVAVASVGDAFTVLEDAGEWLKIQLSEGAGYIRKDLIERIDNAMKANMIVRTGGFVYERTLTLETVLSVEVDVQYEMRSSEATVTLQNPNGYFSPDYFPMVEYGMKKSPFAEYDSNGDVIGVLSDNTPIRIYMGYGQQLVRVFTGLIDDVDVDGEAGTLTLRCTDMMKKLNNYYTHKELKYPPDDTMPDTAWLTSSVIYDMATLGGMTSWRVASDDLDYPDLEVDETYYSELNPNSGKFIKINPDGSIKAVDINAVPDEMGWRNPHAVLNKIIQAGACLGEELDTMCQSIDFWIRCDRYGTFKATSVNYGTFPVATFRDSDNLITLSKNISGTRVRNHIIVIGGNVENHFFDPELWKATKGERRTAKISVPWADDYGKQKAVADKIFQDIKRARRTLQCCIEGNPYLDLFDMVVVEEAQTATRGQYIIKGVRHSFAEGQGYMTFLDAFWEAWV